MDSGVVQRPFGGIQIGPKLWARGPEQGHTARNVRSRHRGAAQDRIGIIGGVIARAVICTRRGDVRFKAIAAINCNRAAAAEGRDRISSGV
jgi:hypothetical protein